MMSKTKKIIYFFILIFLPFFSAKSCLAAGPAFPLKVSTDGRHLADQNNTPFLMVGECAWTILSEVSDPDVDTYLNDRQAKGINTILVMMEVHAYPGFDHAPADYYGHQPFTKAGDFSTPNDAYFAHVDSVLNKAADRGILVLLAPAYLGYQCGNGVTPEGWCSELIAGGTAKATTYGNYIGNRYKDFGNIIWVNGGDVNAGSYGASSVMTAVINGIKSRDTNHLHTAHCSRNNSSYDCYNASWLDVNTTYSDCTSSAAKTSSSYNQVAKPFFYIEGVYEAEGVSQQCLDSQSYWSVLGGSSGAVFGTDPVFYFGSGWKNKLNTQGIINQSHFGSLFGPMQWSNFAPDYQHSTLTSGYGSLSDSTYVGAARSNDGKDIVAYLPTRTTVTVNMAKISYSTVTARWFNPTTANYTDIGSYANSGTRNFTPPSSGDWVLLLAGSESGDSNAPAVPSALTVQ
jgi:hypothetical protein